jgi:predicted acyltransferase
MMTTVSSAHSGTGVAMARLASLDVFRGFNILAMILVNDPGDGSHTYSPLLHATWDRITPTDLVFPFFMFIVGVALAAALRPYWSGARAPDRALYLRLARRAAVLILLGLLINGLPTLDVATWRIPGVVFATASLANTGGGLLSMEMASLLYACLFTLAIWMLLYVPYRRRWFIRV